MAMSRLSVFLLCLAVYIGTLSYLPPLGMFTRRLTPDIEFLPFVPGPTPKREGPYAPNQLLEANTQYIELGIHEGPESISINKKGDIYFSLKSGEIRYIEAPITLSAVYTNGSKLLHESKTFFHGGRPLGIYFDHDDNLLVADAVKGLIRVDKTTKDATLLVTSYGGKKLTFINDVTSSPDGMIYFSDSSSIAPIFDSEGDWNTQLPSMFSCVSSNPNGKLLSYNPKTKEVKVLIDGLQYANGVTMDENNESVYVAETATFKIWRYWISGPNAGKATVLINDLPGFPDGIRLGQDNRLYIGIYGGRTWFLDFLLQHPLLKRAVLRIPFYTPPTSPPFVAIANAKTGEILQTLQSSKTSHFKTVTSAMERDGLVYIGNLYNNFIGVYNINANSSSK